MTPRPARSRPNEHNSASRHARPAVAAAPAIELIAAVAANGVIGAGNRIPWRIPEDLRRFRTLTTGHAVIMGRRTWDSLPNALPGRQNIVVTRQTGFRDSGAEAAGSFDAALSLVRLPAPVFCIGGGELYRAALPRASTLHLTEIARDFAGDAHFPRLDAGDWRETARETHRIDGANGFAYAYVTYVRVPEPVRET